MATTFLEPGTDATGDLSFFASSSTTNGTIATDTTQFQDGLRSLKSNVTLSGGFAYAVTPNGVCADAGTRVSCWVRFSTVTPATATYFMGPEQANDGAAIIGVGITTAGKLRICGRSATAVDGTTALVANTWYRISLTYVITSTSVYTAKVFINGVLEATANAGTLALITTSCLVVGIDANSSVDTFGTPAVMSVWYDSLYIDNSNANTDPGNIHLTAKRPFSNGTTNGFTTQVGAGGSGYGTGHAPQVNEEPLSATNGWAVTSAGSAITEEYNIEGASVGDVNISAATLVDYVGWVYTKALIAETGQIIINGVTSNISITTANALFTKVAGSATYPAGTGTDIGEITSTTVTTVTLYECGIIFAYTPATVVAAVASKLFLLLGAGT